MSLYADTKFAFESLVKRNSGNNALRDYEKDIRGSLDCARIFRLDEDIADVLIHTDSEIEYVPSPFPVIFLESKIRLTEKIIIKGLLIMDLGDDLEQKEQYSKIGINYKGSLMMWFNAEELVQDKWIEHFSGATIPIYFSKEGKEDLYDKDFKKWDERTKSIDSNLDDEKVREQIGIFALSFLNFINNPEIELVHRLKTDAKVESEYQRKGKIINKEDYYIKLTGKIRRYVDEFNTQNLQRINNKHIHSWVVRGYYMHFSSERYKLKRGLKTWVSPYIKGLGEIKRKEYLISEKKVWFNQLKMEEIIRSLFPNHFIVRNTRGFLDGLEIDCYIPHLKLGFEYNGEQHYEQIEAFHKTKDDFDNQVKRDILKNELANQKGIKLITIRFDEELTEELIKSRLKDKQLNNTDRGEEPIKV